MTKRSMYVDKTDPFHTAESRTHIIPATQVPVRLPFVKTATVPAAARKAQNDGRPHQGRNKYPSVKLNTTIASASTPDFVVAFETTSRIFPRPRHTCRDAKPPNSPSATPNLHVCNARDRHPQPLFLIPSRRRKSPVGAPSCRPTPLPTVHKDAMRCVIACTRSPNSGTKIQDGTSDPARARQTRIEHVDGVKGAKTATIAWIGDNVQAVR
jgi:hypothetical protein